MLQNSLTYKSSPSENETFLRCFCLMWFQRMNGNIDDFKMSFFQTSTQACKERRSMQSTEEFWSRKQFDGGNSNNIEQWLIARQRIGKHNNDLNECITKGKETLHFCHVHQGIVKQQKCHSNPGMNSFHALRGFREYLIYSQISRTQQTWKCQKLISFPRTQAHISQLPTQF